MLSGYELSGWTWATVDDTNALFNYYITLNHPFFTGYYPVGPGQTNIEELFANFALDFFDDGWRPTSDVLKDVQTTTTEGRFFVNAVDVARMEGQYFPSDPVGNYSIADTSNHPHYADVGGWFYRTKVPTPATLTLLGIGLAGLGWTRRRRASTETSLRTPPSDNHPPPNHATEPRHLHNCFQKISARSPARQWLTLAVCHQRKWPLIPSARSHTRQ